MKKNNYTKSILNDELFRKCPQAKQKELKKAGRGNKDKAAVAITDEQVDHLKRKQLQTNETTAASTNKTRVGFFEGAVISGGQFTIPLMHFLPRRSFKPGILSSKPPKEGGRESELRSSTQI